MKDLIIKDLATVLSHWDIDREARTEATILAESVYDYVQEFIRINKQIIKEKSNVTATKLPRFE